MQYYFGEEMLSHFEKTEVEEYDEVWYLAKPD